MEDLAELALAQLPPPLLKEIDWLKKNKPNVLIF